jgi:hypothetical protein
MSAYADAKTGVIQCILAGAAAAGEERRRWPPTASGGDRQSGRQGS